MSNATKNAALGESYGAASNRLRKNVMFKLIQQLGLDSCYRCEDKIETAEALSVEHKEAWLQADNPREAFFDLNNIAFSHLSCNSRASRGTSGKTWGMSTIERKDKDTKWRQSEAYKSYQREYQRTRYQTDPEFANYHKEKFKRRYASIAQTDRASVS